MKALIFFAAAAGLAGCMEQAAVPATATSASSQIIASEAQFRSEIVGKTLSFEGNSFTFAADGTISGPWDGQGIRGTWNWDNGAVCREASIGPRVLDPDCQTFSVDGTTATVTRNRGAGRSFDYSIR